MFSRLEQHEHYDGANGGAMAAMSMGGVEYKKMGGSVRVLLVYTLAWLSYIPTFQIPTKNEIHDHYWHSYNYCLHAHCTTHPHSSATASTKNSL